MIDTSFNNNMQMMMMNLVTKLLEKQTAEVTNSDGESSSTFSDVIQQVSEKYGIDEELIYSVLTSGSELSTGSLFASSSSNLMQLLTDSSEDSDASDSLSSIYGGSGYLQTLLSLYGGDIEQALETYNTGTDAINLYKGISSNSGSQSYASKILEYYLDQQGKEA